MAFLRGRAGGILLWIVTIFGALTMGLAGFSKYASAALWQARFASWGYPRPLALLVGALEMAGAVLLLVPGLSAYAAGVLAGIMLVALATVLTHPGELTWTASSVQLVVMSLIFTLRVVRRPRVDGGADPDSGH